jgi:hypothetical protein
MNLNCIGSFLNNQGLTINRTAASYTGKIRYSDGAYMPVPHPELSDNGLLHGNFLQITKDIFQLAFDVRYPVVSMGSLIIGRQYYISVLGDTDFTKVGATANRVGLTFIATDSGSSAGAGGRCNDISGNVQTGMNFEQYRSLTNMGYAVPILTNTPPHDYYFDPNSITCKFGFLGEFAVQAFDEFYLLSGSYADFFSTFSTILGYKDTTNTVIDSLSLSINHLDGIYSNMNDLITGDITGVSLSTFFWGQDLIKLGRALDLQTIQYFGNPDNLLRTIAKNKAMTNSLSIAFAAAGLATSDITEIINGKSADNNQQKLLYACYNMISGTDLEDVLIPLNCHTVGLDTLADLLNLKKIFPNSYQSLTFPQYNTMPRTTNSKTYYLLYEGTNVHKIPSLSYGTRLFGILPADIAYACDAFSMSMRQIKNIQNIDIEKFAQVVTNLENVNDLNVNSTSVPVNLDAVHSALRKIALGSDVNGKFRTADFFGCMTNIMYDWPTLHDMITKLATLPEIPVLAGHFQAIFNAFHDRQGSFTSTDFQNLVSPRIADIDSLVTTMSITYSDILGPIDTLYNNIGGKLAREQLFRKQVFPGGVENTTSSNADIYGFIDSLSTYSSETKFGETASVIENIADLTTIGGSNLIGSMREARNSQRMGLMGGELDNKIETTPLTLPIPRGVKTTVATTTGNFEVFVDSGTPIPGSLNGSPQSTLVPDNLNVLNMATVPSILVPSIARDYVHTCNCDCWDLLQ